MTLIEKLVPLIRSLAKRTGASFVSLGLNRQHCAITLLPRRAVGPKRLREVIAGAGLTPDFFEGSETGGVRVLSAGSMGQHALQGDTAGAFFQAQPQKLAGGRFRPVLSIAIERHGLPVGPWAALPLALDLLVYLNGQRLTVEQLGVSAEQDTPATPFKLAWQAGERRGAVHLCGRLRRAVLIQDGGLRTCEDVHASLAVVVDEGLPVEDMAELLEAIAPQMREKLIASEEALAAWEQGLDLNVAQFPDILRSEGAARLARASFEGQRTLAILLGFGLGTRFQAMHMIYDEGAELRSARLHSRPVALPGYPTVSSAVLPAELPIVAEDDAPPYALKAIPRARGASLPEAESNGLVTVRLADRITAGEHPLPYLLAAPESPIELDGGPAPPGGAARLLIARDGRPIQDIWWELSACRELLRAVCAGLLQREGERCLDLLGPAIPRREYGAVLDLDYSLAAALLLSQHRPQTDEERIFCSRAVAELTRSAAHLAEGKPCACNDEKGACEHGSPAECFSAARDKAIAALRRFGEAQVSHPLHLNTSASPPAE